MNNGSDVVNVNAPRDFMPDSFGDTKFSKSAELNASMSITNAAPDEYTRKAMNLFGGDVFDN